VKPPAGNKTFFYYTADDRLRSINPINAVENASFEVDSDGNSVPDSWTSNGQAYATVAKGTELTEQFGSTHLSIQLAPPAASIGYAVYLSNHIPVNVNAAYRLSAYVKANVTSGSHNTVASVIAYDASNNSLGEIFPRAEQTGPLQDWTQLTAALAPNQLPPGTATVRIKVAASNNGGSTGGAGTSSFAGVQLEEGTAVTAFSAPVTYTVDPNSLAAAMYDGNGRKVKWTYNDSGNLLSTAIDPENKNYRTEFTWVSNKPNLLETVKDANTIAASGSQVTRFDYDPMGNLTQVTDKLGKRSKFEYNTLNDFTKYTDPKEMEKSNPQSRQTMTYDGKRNAVAAIDRFGMSGARAVDRTNCLGCVLSETPPLSTTDNLLTNASFERSASGSWPDGWTLRMGAASYINSISAPASPIFLGSRVIAAAPTPTQMVEITHPDITIGTATSFVLSLYVQGDTTELAGLGEGRLEFIDGNNAVISGAAQFTNRIKRANEWNRIFAVVPKEKIPSNAQKVRVVLTAYPPSTSGGNVYFDGVQLERSPYLSAFNLADNPGLERGTTGPELWGSWGQSFTWSSDAVAGAKSVALSNAAVTALFEPLDPIPYNRDWPLTLTAFIKTDNLQNANAHIKLSWCDASQNYIGQTLGDAFLGLNHEWTRSYAYVSANPSTTVVPSAAVYVKPTLAVAVNAGATATGTAYFDAVRLEQAELVTAYQRGGPGTYNDWVTQVKNPVGDFVNYAYDDSGFRTNVIPNGVTSEQIVYTADDLKRLKKVELPNGLTTEYAYTVNGLLLTTTHQWTDVTAQTAQTTFAYNLRDELTGVTDPLNRTTLYTRDAAGTLTKVTQPTGAYTAFTYDSANRLVERTLGTNGTPSLAYSFEYDANGNLKKAFDTTRTWQFNYDALDRMQQATNLVGSVTYSYDENSNLTQRSVSAGSTQTNDFIYDELDHLLRVEDTANAREYARFSYDEQGRVVKAVSGNIIYSVMEYDGAGRLKKVQNLKSDSTFLSSYEYVYDSRGNRKKEIVNGTTTTDFAYDALGQILDDGTYTYTYTPRGNRKSRTGPGGTTTNYCYDAADQLTYVGSGTCGSGSNLTYDDNGNLEQYISGSDTWDYSYDAENRLIQVKLNGTTKATFTYDAFGRRASKTVNSVERKYHYDGRSNRVLYETEGSTVKVWYTWAGDQLISQTQQDGNIYYYQYNGHGDVIALYAANGALKNVYAYDVWGNPTYTSEQVENPYRYAGYRWDAETGLYFLNARYYDPSLGRFSTQDTVPTQPTYAYSLNNPVVFADPTGNIAEIALLPLAGPIGWVIGAVIVVGGAAGCAVYSPCRESVADAVTDFWSTPSGGTGCIDIACSSPLVWNVRGIDSDLPPRNVAKGDTGKVEHYYPNDHEPAHMHVKDKEGNVTRIGPNGKPLKGDPELTAGQRKVVQDNLRAIRKAGKQIGKWLATPE
jgi:RHS repeat-associated protein